MPEIILKNVTKRFGKFAAVENLNLIIPDRSFITLLGPSGCGKTTTLRMIAGLEDPTSGKITIDGKVVFDSEKGINISPAKRDVGFLFQNYALWPHMTVYKNIAFGLKNLKWKKEDIDKRVNELLALLKIEKLGNRYPSELSGGQQQRVAIARTLAPQPKILFMDEPLSNLDAKLRLEMRTELKRLFKSTDSTFVYVTHDQLEAMTLSTKLCLMKEGVVEQYDTALFTYAHPNNTFVADFVGSPTINFVEGVMKHNGGKHILSFSGKEFEFVKNPKVKTPIDTASHLLEVELKEYLKTKEQEEPEKQEEILDTTSEEQAPKVTLEEASKVIVGIRPEYLRIGGKGIEGVIYSSLPSGMSTTVLINLNDTILTSVAFGIIDYQQDDTVKFEIVGDGIIIFDAETKQNLGEGTLKEI